MEKTKIKKNTEVAKPEKATASLEAKIFNQKGAEAGSIKLPESIFGLPWNSDLVHQVVVSMQSNKRANTADTKDRSEVSGTGKKPWAQKGTGRARHGSRRSNIWVGGGVSHGPTTDRNYKKKINKKMKAKALFTILSDKFNKNQIIFIDNVALGEIKTKNAVEVMNTFAGLVKDERIGNGFKPYVEIFIPEQSDNIQKSFNNIPQVSVDEIRNINPLQLLSHKYLFIVNPENAISFLTSKIEKGV